MKYYGSLEAGGTKMVCAIGDETLTLHGRDGRTEEFPVADAISEARAYIQSLGGFESFAEWGLIR